MLWRSQQDDFRKTCLMHLKKEGDMRKGNLIFKIVSLIVLTCFGTLLFAQENNNNQAIKNDSDKGDAPSTGETYRLHISCISGFKGNTITITVNDRKELELSGVTTGGPYFSGSFDNSVNIDVKVTSKIAKVIVCVEPGGYKNTIEVDVTRYHSLSVSLDAKSGKIIFYVSEVYGRG
jgi:hypothetical protein